ncbi:hypothetical protein [Sporisorium scitamineum]|uniref:Uncharacterized protein n=1 Tax=Sporisorium scitamineum TaxID=49012 RepID=A0A0F7S1I0_9BASI|nr:hypothetical protein [Sporisorium scitamineum]
MGAAEYKSFAVFALSLLDLSKLSSSMRRDWIRRPVILPVRLQATL